MSVARARPTAAGAALSPVLALELAHRLEHGAAEAGRRVRNEDARLLQSRDLVVGGVLAARDDGAGMTHPAARRRRAPGNEAGDRLRRALGLVVLGALDLGVAADLADHDDAFRLVVLE